MFANQTKKETSYRNSQDQQVENLLITERVKMLGPAHVQKLLLGSGRFYKVYRVDMEDGKSFAVKQLKRESSSQGHFNTVVNEVMALMNTDHPNIAKLIGKYRD